jgi:carbon storage regulator
MLVLTRKYQEKIRIGDNITITVLRTKGKAVRLGIEAPANVPVIRGELSFEHESEEAVEPAATVSFDEAAPVKRLACAGGMAAATRWATSQDSEPRVAQQSCRHGAEACFERRTATDDDGSSRQTIVVSVG